MSCRKSWTFQVGRLTGFGCCRCCHLPRSLGHCGTSNGAVVQRSGALRTEGYHGSLGYFIWQLASSDCYRFSDAGESVRVARLSQPVSTLAGADLPAWVVPQLQVRCVRFAATCAAPHLPAWTMQPTAQRSARAAAAGRRGGLRSSCGAREVRCCWGRQSARGCAAV